MRLQLRPGRHPGRRRAPWARQVAACLPRAYPLARRRLGEAQLHFPPSSALAPSVLAQFEEAERITGAPSSPRVAIDVPERKEVVPRVPLRVLRRSAEDGEQRASIADEFELAPSPEPKEIGVDYLTDKPSQLKPSPPLQSW